MSTQLAPQLRTEGGVQAELLGLLELVGLGVHEQLVVQLQLQEGRMWRLVEPQRHEVLVVLAEHELAMALAVARERGLLQQGGANLLNLLQPLE